MTPSDASGDAAMALDCLVYLPTIYRGGGPPFSCVSILEQFRSVGVRPVLCVYQVKSAIPASIDVVETMNPVRRLLNGGAEKIPLLRRFVNFRLSDAVMQTQFDDAFEAEMQRRDPDRTLVYFWPTPPRSLLKTAQARGFIIVREMINSPCTYAKAILDAVYVSRDTPNPSPIFQDVAEEQQRELTHYDGIFASNPEVERALIEEGIPVERILPASFGYEGAAYTLGPKAERPFTCSFVGSHSYRKGLPDLLDAWDAADVDGVLVLAGTVEGSLLDRVRAMEATGRVRNAGYVSDVEAVYRASDVFVLPTHEDGGPQVTYEAAATGLPVITTPMGAARLVDETTGIVVPAGDVGALAEAIRTLAYDPDLRARLGARARARAADFDYVRVGKRRGVQLIALHARHKKPGNAIT